jgi:hypothetical protein
LDRERGGGLFGLGLVRIRCSYECLSVYMADPPGFAIEGFRFFFFFSETGFLCIALAVLELTL